MVGYDSTKVQGTFFHQVVSYVAATYGPTIILLAVYVKQKNPSTSTFISPPHMVNQE